MGCWAIGELMVVIEMVVDDQDDREVDKVEKVVTKEWTRAKSALFVLDSKAWVRCALAMFLFFFFSWGWDGGYMGGFSMKYISCSGPPKFICC